MSKRQNPEQALRESEARYRFLYNKTPVMMKAVDVESRIIDANDYYLNALGYTREEVIGQRSTDFLTEESQRRVAEKIPPQLLTDGNLHSTECRIICKNGEILDAEVFAAAEMDTDGNVKQILSFFIDRTDRKRAERLQNQNLYLLQELQTERNDGDIVGDAPAMKSVFKNINLVANTDATVLLLGETGTGKELVAQAIHNRSGRKDSVMIKLNCGALPANLVESELFGHEKGAFTGAAVQKKGRFELAHGGTLFLDEVGELPLETQTKLLRVLQEQSFERIGGSQILNVDVRIIAATNRDLEAQVKQGAFRADLFYRLNIFPIQLPPLRERKSDIPLLARHLVEKAAARMGKHIEKINADVLDKLMACDWPGNVRELANILERAVILCQDATLKKEHILGLSAAPAGAAAFPTLEEMERDHIRAALEKTRGVLAGPNGAAALLGLNRSTLWSRMQKLGIQVARQVADA